MAVVGASEREGSYGGEALRNLARLGYPGRVYAVNPRHDEVFGVRSYPALEDLPEAPDAVVVAIPAAGAPEVVGQARALGCGGAVVFAAGFAEARGGEALQRELAAAADGLPVCGPNGNGIVGVWDRVALWGDSVAPREPGPVALVSQSGNVAVNALASRRGPGLHTVVSCGNEAVLTAADFTCALAERDGVRAIALYLEADGDGDAWCDALERCLEAGIGVAVLKAGSSRAGVAAAGAHTGAVAGDQRIFRALFEEAGAAWAEDPHDLLELAKALAAQRRPRAATPGVAVMTCSGGDSAVAADLAAELGVPLPALAARTLDRLRAVLPASATAANPLDYTSLLWDDQAALRELVLALADDPAVGQVLVLYDDAGFEDASWAAVLDAVRQAGEVSAVPVTVAATLPELAAEGAIAGLRSGLRAVRPRPAGTVRRERRGRTSGRWLDEPAVKQALREAGIDVPDGRVTGDAVAAWRELGGPVAVKRIGLLHKARAGGVVLNLDDADSIQAAQERLGGTVLVERMAPPGVELLVSVKRDGFVPVLVLGLGGVWTELLDDVVVLPLPVTAADVHAGLTRLRGAKALEGVDVAAAAELAVRLSHTDFVLVELNPVIVHAHGAVAVDALADEEVLR